MPSAPALHSSSSTSNGRRARCGCRSRTHSPPTSTPRRPGWQSALGWVSTTLVALVLWSVVELLVRQEDPLRRLIGPALSAVAGTLVAGSVFRQHWRLSSEPQVPWRDYTTVAWIELGLGALLVGLGIARFASHGTATCRGEQ